MIVLNLVLFIVSTVEWIATGPAKTPLNVIDAISVAIFTIEFFLRLWICVERKKYARLGPILGFNVL